MKIITTRLHLFFFFFFLLPLFPLSSATPVCHSPAPAPSLVPRLTDCYELVRDIFDISQLEYDEPVLWTRNPPSGTMGVRKLPYSFNYTDPFGSKENDCEFVVDAIVEGKEDVFPVKDVAIQGRKVVRKCMVEGVQGRETVGAEAVGPKRGIVVVLLKRLGVDADEEEGLSGSLKVLNGNGERLLPLFNASRARARLIGDV